MEVMATPTGPCLVECGARCHGGEGTWKPIADACVGYNQIHAALDVYIAPDQFDMLPFVPPPMRTFGREVFMVSYHDGVIAALPGVDAIRRLPSFAKLEMMCQPRSALRKTVDCFTRPGAVQLISDDQAAVEADARAIRALEKDGLFVMEGKVL